MLAAVWLVGVVERGIFDVDAILAVSQFAAVDVAQLLGVGSVGGQQHGA